MSPGPRWPDATYGDRSSDGFGQGSVVSVLAACRLVGDMLGVKFPESLTEQPMPFDGEESLMRLAEAAGVRTRRVALRGTWWREDAGPLLGFAVSTGEAIALLPRRRGGYTAFQTGGEPFPVTPDLARTLADFGYTFCRTLPPTPIAFLDLVWLALRGLRHEAVVVLAVTLLLGILGIVAPLALGALIDHVIPGSDRNQLAQLVAALFGVALAAWCVSLFRSETALRLETRAESAIQAALWDRVLKLPPRFFRRYSAGDLAQRINALNEIYQQFSGTAINGLLGGLFSFINLVLLIYLSPRLALIASVLVAIVLAGNGFLAFLIVSKERRHAELQGKLGGQVLDYLTGIAKLRGANAQERGFYRWAETFALARGIHADAQRLRNTADVFVSTFSVVAGAIIFLVVAQANSIENTGDNMLNTGGIVAFTGIFANFFLQFTAFSNTVLSLLHVLPDLERASPILDAQPETGSNGMPVAELRGDVTVENLVFSYRKSGQPIIDGVTFTVKQGKFLAIVGPSGSGKSTLIRLLLGFEIPDSGIIRFDEKNLCDLEFQSLRKQLGVVLQSGQLMPGDIFSNIAGGHNPSIDAVWEAARLSGLDKDIAAMPMGMHTLLSEGPSTLSGGQRQRLLIARALVMRPRLLLLDEASSALDNRMQEWVGQSLAQLRATRIAIAHRLTSVANADRILVMERGRIVQSGRYAELLEQEGLFREMARRQMT